MRTSPRNCSLCGNSFYSGTAQSSKMAIGTTGDFAKAYFNAIRKDSVANNLRKVNFNYRR